VAARRDQGLRLFQRLPDHLIYGDWQEGERHQPVGHARRIEQVIDQAAHMRGLAPNDRTGLGDAGPVQMDQSQQVRGAGDRRQRIAQLVGEHGQEFVLVARFQQHLFVAQALFGVLFGDVIALDEDALDLAASIRDRLVDEVQDAFREYARGALEADRLAIGHDRFAAAIGLVEHVDEALTDQLGKGVAHRLADMLARAGQVDHRRIDQFEYVVGSAQHRHEAGRLLEQRLEPVDVGQQAEIGFVHILGALEDPAVGRHQGERRVLGMAGYFAQPFQFGDVDGMLQHVFHLTVRAEHR